MSADYPVPDPLARERAQQENQANVRELSLAILAVQWTLTETREDDTRTRMRSVLKGLQRVLGRMEREGQ